MPSLPTCFRRAPSFLIQMEVLTGLGGGEGGWRRRRMGAHVYQAPVLCHLLYPLRIKIHLSCPRQYTLGQLLPRGHLLTVRRVTLGAGSSSDGNHRKWLPRPSIFPRREKSPMSLGPTETRQPFFPRCHQEYMLARSLARKPNTLSSLCVGLHPSQGLSYFPGVKWGIQSGLSGSWAPGGHSVLGRRKTLNMSLEYFSHFKKGYGSRECPPAALRWAPRWASRLAGVPKWLAETNYGQSSSRGKGKQDWLGTRTCTVFL